MHTSQALFLLLGIEPGIPRVCPWRELLAIGAQATWFVVNELVKVINEIHVKK